MLNVLYFDRGIESASDLDIFNNDAASKMEKRSTFSTRAHLKHPNVRDVSSQL